MKTKITYIPQWYGKCMWWQGSDECSTLKSARKIIKRWKRLDRYSPMGILKVTTTAEIYEEQNTKL